MLTETPLSISQREAVIEVEGRLIVDEDKLDLFKYSDNKIPDWQPTNNVKPFKELNRVYIDIETTGLDPLTDTVVLIGVMNDKGDYKIYHSQKERVMLLEFLNDLPRWNPDVISLFNGFSFDLPFIIKRCEINRIDTKYHFYVSEYLKTFRTAQKFGKPAQYYPIYYNGIRNKHVAIIDLYHQVLAWDFVKRIMTSHTLKESVKQMPSITEPLRKEDRTELDYPMMLRCIKAWDIPKQKEPYIGKTGREILEEYLVYDLEDTKLLGEYLLPSIYYQKLILPPDAWNLQKISVGGNGSKWNSILEDEYKFVKTDKGISYIENIEASEKLKYDGGYTFARAGLYRNVSKIDVASLYPSVMLTYGIYTNKDLFGKMLAILYWLTKERLRLKKIGKDKTGKYTKEESSDAKQMEASMKVMINSCFTGETLVTTDNGVFPIKELIGKKTNVVNRNGEWSEVEFKSYGEAQIWEVTLTKNGEDVTLRTTENHRWLAAPLDSNDIEYDCKLTRQLKEGMLIPYIKTPNQENDRSYEKGEQWRVKSVKYTTTREEVYCCVEPKTSYFVLHKGILTGNCYGALGTMGVKFNDYFAAALVTAYGRKIAKLMVEKIEEHGGIISSVDTDGVYYATNDDTFEKNRFIHQKVQEAMPNGINIDYEDDIEAVAFYVPPLDNKKFSKKKLKEMGIEEGQFLDEGLRKNYIIMTREGKTKANGKYRKRDRCKLEKDFTPKLMEHYVKSPIEATKFYLVVKKQIEERTISLDFLTVNRKIKRTEKTIIELGLGRAEEVITFYEAYQEPIIDPNKKVRRNSKPKPTNVKKLAKDYDSDFDIKFYLDIITTQYKEFMAMAKKIEVVTSLNSLVRQDEGETNLVTL